MNDVVGYALMGVAILVAIIAIIQNHQTSKILKETEKVLGGTQHVLLAVGKVIDLQRAADPLASTADGQLVGGTFEQILASMTNVVSNGDRTKIGDRP